MCKILRWQWFCWYGGFGELVSLPAASQLQYDAIGRLSTSTDWSARGRIRLDVSVSTADTGSGSGWLVSPSFRGPAPRGRRPSASDGVSWRPEACADRSQERLAGVRPCTAGVRRAWGSAVLSALGPASPSRRPTNPCRAPISRRGLPGNRRFRFDTERKIRPPSID